jgi:hypothetical protein
MAVILGGYSIIAESGRNLLLVTVNLRYIIDFDNISVSTFSSSLNCSKVVN